MVAREALVKARGERKQEELARLCGVRQQTYSHWERGRCTPGVAKMLVLERLLGRPKEELFFDIFNSCNE